METFEEEAEQRDCKWLFKVRRNSHGEFERYKARLVEGELCTYIIDGNHIVNNLPVDGLSKSL
jgi:hypothetical protein